jgi:hypothetical protein
MFKNAVEVFSKVVNEGGTDAMKETEIMKNHGDYAKVKNFNHNGIQMQNSIHLNIPSEGEL